MYSMFDLCNVRHLSAFLEDSIPSFGLSACWSCDWWLLHVLCSHTYLFGHRECDEGNTYPSTQSGLISRPPIVINPSDEHELSALETRYRSHTTSICSIVLLCMHPAWLW